MMRLCLTPLFSLLLLVINSCTILNSDDPDKRSELEQAVYEAIYEGKRTPPAFYTSEIPTGVYVRYLGHNVYYEEFDGRLVWLQMCDASANKAQARILESMADIEVDVVARQHTDSYFEFDVNPSDSHPRIERVHKCSYIEKAAFGTSPGFLQGIVIAGPVAFQDINQDSVQLLFDRLWYYRNYRIGGVFILEREVTDQAEKVTYETLEGRASFIAQRSNVPTIGNAASARVYRSIYTVEKATGQVEIDRIFVKEIDYLQR